MTLANDKERIASMSSKLTDIIQELVDTTLDANSYAMNLRDIYKNSEIDQEDASLIVIGRLFLSKHFEVSTIETFKMCRELERKAEKHKEDFGE